jgi:hypothetical protein
MPLPKVPPLSLSAIRQQFGGPVGTPLSAYRAGGAYVPAGTRNGLNLPIPSSAPLSISDFLGAPNGIQLADYYTNMGYYFRNFPNYQAAQTPQLSTNNNNATDYSIPPGGGNYGGVTQWQNYYFSNAGRTVSQGCTVIYTTVGCDTSGGPVQGVRPGGSATGAIQVAAGYQAFYAWAEANKHLLAPVFLYVDYKNTSTKALTVIAWYACSVTAITKITGGWQSNGQYKHQNTTFPCVQIVPGYWTPAAIAFTPSAYTLNVAPNSWAFTASQRDGDGGYQLEHNASMGFWQEYDDHWYNNASFQTNYNPGVTTQSVTYSAQGSAENGVIYNFTQSPGGGYTGPNIPNGSTIRGFGSAIIEAKTPFAASGGTSHTASVVFMPSGGAYGTGDGGATAQAYDSPFGGGADVVPAWWVGASLTGTGPGFSHWVRATPSGGTNGGTFSGNVNAWVPISSNISFDFTYTGATSDSGGLSFQIATDASGGGAVTIGTVTLVVVNGSSGGGGGGGGGCVGASMMMDTNRAASGIAVGDVVDGVAYNPDGIVARTVRSNVQQLEPSWRMTTVSGIELDASNSTPMTLKDGSSKMFGPDMVGELVLVDDRGEIRWEEVATMQDLGWQVVVRFNVDDHSYFAGTVGDRRIASHNVLK